MSAAAPCNPDLHLPLHFPLCWHYSGCQSSRPCFCPLSEGEAGVSTQWLTFLATHATRQCRNSRHLRKAQSKKQARQLSPARQLLPPSGCGSKTQPNGNEGTHFALHAESNLTYMLTCTHAHNWTMHAHSWNTPAPLFQASNGDIGHDMNFGFLQLQLSSPWSVLPQR